MRNFLIITLIFFCSSFGFSQPDPITGGSKMETVIKTTDSIVHDSVAVNTIVDAVKDATESAPTAGQSFLWWVLWVLTPIYIIAGVIISHIPTEKSHWYLRLIPNSLKFLQGLLKMILIPNNKKKDGGNHTL